MKPTALQVQKALRFLADVPTLFREGKLEAELCSHAFDGSVLAEIARQLGYEVSKDAIAEAFRIRMLARQAISMRGKENRIANYLNHGGHPEGRA